MGDGVLAQRAEVMKCDITIFRSISWSPVGDGVLAQHAEVTRCERPMVMKMTVGDGVLDVPLG